METVSETRLLTLYWHYISSEIPLYVSAVTGGYKYRDQLLCPWGWMQGWSACFVKILLFRNPKKWKPDNKYGRILQGRLWLKIAVLRMMIMMIMIMIWQYNSTAPFMKDLEPGTSVELLWYFLCRNNRQECRYGNLLQAGNFCFRMC